MPTTVLDLVADAQTAVKMRWQEPYVTEGLNAKLAVAVPRGILRGFRLTTHASALTVSIQADPDHTDHAAVYLTSAGYALSVRKTGGNFLAALAASTTYVFALWADYSVGSATSAEVRAYTLAEWSALSATVRDELVALGTVTTPASGVIPAANITPDRRVMAWDNWAKENRPWVQLIRNGGFENGPLSSALSGDRPDLSAYVLETRDPYDSRFPFWHVSLWDAAAGGAGTVSAAVTAADSYEGRQSLRLRVEGTGSPFDMNVVAARAQIAAVPSTGRRFKVRFAYKTPVAFVSGQMRAFALFADDEQASPAHYSQVTDLGALDISVSSSWKVFEATFDGHPSGKRLWGFDVRAADSAFSGVVLSLNVAAPTTFFYLDSVSLWAEVDDRLANDLLEGRYAAPVPQIGLVLEDGRFLQNLDPTLVKFLLTYEANQLGGGDFEDDIGPIQRVIGMREDQDKNTGVQPILHMIGGVRAGTDGTAATEEIRKRTPFRALSPNLTYCPIIEAAPDNGSTSYPSVILYAKPAQSRLGLVIAIGCRWNETTAMWEDTGALAAVGPSNYGAKIELGCTLAPGSTTRFFDGIRMFTRSSYAASWADDDTGWEQGTPDRAFPFIPGHQISGSTVVADLLARLAGGVVLGQALATHSAIGYVQSTEAEVVPRIKTLQYLDTSVPPSNSYSLIAEFNRENYSPSRPIRIYLGADGSLHITSNAVWDGFTAAWSFDETTGDALKLSFGGKGTAYNNSGHNDTPDGASPTNPGKGYFSLAFRDSTQTSPWPDNNWGSGGFGSTLAVDAVDPSTAGGGTRLRMGHNPDVAGYDESPSIELFGQVTTGHGPRLKLRTSNITLATAPQSNTLYSKTIAKAWCTARRENASTNWIIDEAFNVSSITYDFGGGQYYLYFHTAMNSNRYVVVHGGVATNQLASSPFSYSYPATYNAWSVGSIPARSVGLITFGQATNGFGFYPQGVAGTGSGSVTSSPDVLTFVLFGEQD